MKNRYLNRTLYHRFLIGNLIDMLLGAPAIVSAGGKESAIATLTSNDQKLSQAVTATLGDNLRFFVSNEGQADPAVLFTCKNEGGTLKYTRDREELGASTSTSGGEG